MFRHKKRLKELEDARLELEKEKQELLFIKEQLDNTMSKMDISNVYVWYDNDVYSIVRLEVENIQGRACRGHGKRVNGYRSTLIDIFTNDVLYQKCSVDKIGSRELILNESLTDNHYAYLSPIYTVDRNILAYTDKMVPMYVLQQLYYKLNNVDVNAKILKK